MATIILPGPTTLHVDESRSLVIDRIRHAARATFHATGGGEVTVMRAHVIAVADDAVAAG